ncbi:PREDICTED: melanotransferrin [Papilio polytes]|uniref:melanotransferrin n=1 Tax=Papilio polytes TaxID=76194 RepID=UPI000676AEC1|nr:PREDICTED: melanotransferrin [Papilio polytes]
MNKMAPTYSLVIILLIGFAEAYYNNDNLSQVLLQKEKEKNRELVTWCTTSDLEQEKCEKLAKAVMQDKGLFGDDYREIACKRAFDTEDCMISVDQGEATLLALDAGEVYIAGRYHSLVPIAQELYGNGEPYQYSVAVVRKGSLPSVQPSTGLHGLRGAKACFPGVGALAGWVMPVHILMQEGGLKITDCNNHIKSAVDYFGDSCAPNSLKDIYNPIGDNPDKLCKLCTGGAGIRCTLADPYAGYEGALKCLVSNNTGDIAFVRDTTIQHALLSHKILGGVSEASFELICRDGSRAPVTSWEKCNWGRIPADAVVTSSAASQDQRKRYQNLLQKMVQLYGEPNPYNKNPNNTFGQQNRDMYGNPFSSTERDPYDPYDPYRRNRFNDDKQDNDANRVSTLAPFQARLDRSGQPIELPFQLFVSNETTDLLLQDATINFRMLNEEEQASKHILNNKYVGEQAEKAVLGVRDCPLKRAVLCVTSDPEMDKCVKMRVSCIYNFIFVNNAQITASIYLQVYTSGESWYYAVAVAKEQDPDTDLTYLRGKNTCHAGIATAAGWIYPLAYLLSNGWIRPYGCDGAHAAAQYFSKSCAPGALSAEYVDAATAPHDNLCHLCHGASFRRCQLSLVYPAISPVYSGPQAHLSRQEQCRRRTAYTRYSQKRFFSGTRAKMHEYEHCNLGKVPGAVLMGRANHTELDTYSNLMIYAQQLYGAATSDEFSFSMFYSQPPYADLIFSDAAVRLKPLAHSKRSAEIIAGPALLRAAKIVSCDAPQALYYVAPDPEFLSHSYRTYIMGHVLAITLFMVILFQ